MDGYNYELWLGQDVWVMDRRCTNNGVRRKREIHNTFNKYMCEELITIIKQEVNNNCAGCQIDHPSQLQHELCLLTDTDEHIDMFLVTAIRQLDPYAIMTKWYPFLCEMRLDDQDKIEAYDLWEHIKDRIRFRPSQSWVGELTEQIKKHWK
jgi:hypothetical protein